MSRKRPSLFPSLSYCHFFLFVVRKEQNRAWTHAGLQKLSSDPGIIVKKLRTYVHYVRGLCRHTVPQNLSPSQTNEISFLSLSMKVMPHTHSQSIQRHQSPSLYVQFRKPHSIHQATAVFTGARNSSWLPTNAHWPKESFKRWIYTSDPFL